MADRSLARTTNLLAILAACRSAPPTVVPNDNQVAGTVWRGDTLVFAIEARVAAWTPDPTADSAVTVHAFAAPDHVPRVPGPLLRVTAGATVEIQVANLLNDSALVVHGLRPGTGGDDTVRVAAGTSRTVWFTAAVPGTYLYWGSTTGDRMVRTERREGALAGAIVVDPAGVAPDAGERIFVISVVDITPDTTKPPPREDVFELALNGRSWPATERLVHVVGDTVRWRLLNATATPHPMHLHGFHFTTIAKGDGRQDSTYAAGEERQAVTEYLPDGGGTARIRWVPTRAGSWLFHCHIVDHVVPFPVRSDSARRHDAHDAAGHATRSMSGLVMGIDVRLPSGAALPPVPGLPVRHLRLFAQQSTAPAVGDTAHARGYVLQLGEAAPRPDSIATPGPLLLLTRGERTAITVVNRLPQPTSVHWHGMEIESYYDGVAGWSGADSRRAPLIAPGDSFVAVMTPPRAGTFMYHPHMDEEDQLAAGMFGPMIVREPGERLDPATDLHFMLGDAIVGGVRGATVNGARSFAPLRLRAGTAYRLRFLSLLTAAGTIIRLHTDSIPLRWTPRAKDGADLPAALRAERPARRQIGVGETYDFIWRPTRPTRAELEFTVFDVVEPFRIPIVVR